MSLEQSPTTCNYFRAWVMMEWKACLLPAALLWWLGVFEVRGTYPLGNQILFTRILVVVKTVPQKTNTGVINIGAIQQVAQCQGPSTFRLSSVAVSSIVASVYCCCNNFTIRKHTQGPQSRGTPWEAQSQKAFAFSHHSGFPSKATAEKDT